MRLVATNGVFDILHRGHCEFLRQARNYGDSLVVGLNSDASVRVLKGLSRPINSQTNRKFVLESLEAVSRVEIFDEVRATEFLKKWRPDVYCKAGYSLETMDVSELAILKGIGTEIVFLPVTEGLSTTTILEKLNREP